MSEDLSKSTLLVLVVLTIIISLLGTWTVINEASSQQLGVDGPTESSTSGEVTVNIQAPPQPVSVSGMVAVNIVAEE